MDGYIIFADSSCDLKKEVLEEMNIECINMSFSFENGREYENGEMTSDEFYGLLSDGGIAKTFAINSDKFVGAFEPFLKNGKDILYLGFSSGLSSTYGIAAKTVDILKEKYPERKIFALDTLCESAGYGLILDLAVQKKNSGASIEEVAEFVNEKKLKICHWFTVDDLKYLKRGGRISSCAAALGGILNIKPVLKMDDGGKIVSDSKVRGRKNSIIALAEKCEKYAVANSLVYISHACAEADAQMLKTRLEKNGIKVKSVSTIGAVIGAHCGTGTVALFFEGKSR